MYAILKNGGKQYRVCEGQVVRFEKMNYEIGELYIFNQVILISQIDSIYIGNPYLAIADVVGEIIRHGRCKKIEIIKFRRRKHFRKFQGHRQWFTDIKISKINIC